MQHLLKISLEQLQYELKFELKFQKAESFVNYTEYKILTFYEHFLNTLKQVELRRKKHSIQ